MCSQWWRPLRTYMQRGTVSNSVCALLALFISGEHLGITSQNTILTVCSSNVRLNTSVLANLRPVTALCWLGGLNLVPCIAVSKIQSSHWPLKASAIAWLQLTPEFKVPRARVHCLARYKRPRAKHAAAQNWNQNNFELSGFVHF